VIILEVAAAVLVWVAVSIVQQAAALTDTRGQHTYKYFDGGPDGVVDEYGIDTAGLNVCSVTTMSGAQNDYDRIIEETITNI
jgi:hypothetical protein